MSNIPSQVDKQMIDDCIRSGLTPTDIDQLGFTISPSGDGYKIPYYDIYGKLISNYWRIRHFTDPSDKDAIRYRSPKGSTPRLYFPPNPLNTTWKEIAEDITSPITFTEGEKKAAKASKHGFHCIGLAGVWCFQAKKKDINLLKEFNEIIFKDRHVILCFDNDIYTNPDIMGALSSLARELIKLEAVVYVKYLPKSDKKIGLDDFLTNNSLDKYIDLFQEEYTECNALWLMNDDAIVVAKQSAIYVPRLKKFFSKDKFRDILYANRLHPITVFKGQKKVPEKKQVSTASAWIKWKYRTEVDDVCYTPGDVVITADNELNLWQGWGVEPEQGDVEPFKDLLKYLCPDIAIRKWFKQWLAYPIQHPGAKMYTAVLLCSIQQGTGKTFLGTIISDIYGENAITIGQNELEASFNSWAKCRQFVLGEEITGSDRPKDAAKLKALITQREVLIDEKYLDISVFKDHTNFLFTSNNVTALKLETEDRRICVIDVIGDKPDDAFFAKIDNWYRNENGVSHLFHYLLHNVDTDDFNPRAAAPHTSAKQQMTELGFTDCEILVSELLKNPDSFSGVGRHLELMTPSEVFKALGETKYTSINSVGRALKKSRTIQHSVKIAPGRSDNLYAIRNTEKYQQALDDKDYSVWRKQRLKQEETYDASDAI